MARTVEIGRAVLASSTSNLELWLSTLIIISPSQNSIDIGQLSSHSLLSFLSSGNAWVCRGNGMQIELALTLRGEPFPNIELQVLRDNITEAPIWSQLRLRATIPSDAMLQDGIVHIAINHADDVGLTSERRFHRILNTAPSADTQPPKSVPNFQLQTVRYSMDFHKTKQRPQIKRSNTLPGDTGARQQNSECHKHHTNDTSSHETTTGHVSHGDATPCGTLTVSRKRKRVGPQAPVRSSSSPLLSPIRGVRSSTCPVIFPDLLPTVHNTLTEELVAEVHLMVERAMRLSIYGILRSSTGIKVKANSFDTGLADIAPVLWRPGYLDAISHRAQFVSTVCRSLNRTKAISRSLNEKLQIFASYAPNNLHGGQLGEVAPTSTQPERLSSSLAGHLWSQMQKCFLARSAPPLQAFVACGKISIDNQELGEILDSPDYLEGFITARPFATDKQCEGHLDETGINLKSEFSILSERRQKLSGSFKAAEICTNIPSACDDDLLLDTRSAAMVSGLHDTGVRTPPVDPDISNRTQGSTQLRRFVEERAPGSLGLGEEEAIFAWNASQRVQPKFFGVDQLVNEGLFFEDHEELDINEETWI